LHDSTTGTDNGPQIVTRLAASNLRRRADVCIIGTGAAGCVLAYELTRHDKQVIMLEKGNYYDSEYIRTQPEENLLKLWKNRGVFLSKTFSVNIAQGECIGGSTVINYGICFQIPEPVLAYWKSAFEIDISIEDYRKAYDKISALLNVTKIQNAGRGHELFKMGCNSLGYSCDWMDKAYTPGGEKHNAFDAFLKKAKFDKLQIIANCKADKIVIRNKRAVEVNAISYDPLEKRYKNVIIESKIIIISAGPIASSELLLKSGYAGQNQQVGQHLSLHPSSSVVARFDEEIDGDNGMAMACYCDEFSVRKAAKPGFMLESVFVPPSQMSVTMPSFGEQNKEYLKKYNNYAMAGILVHDEPNGTVELNWSKDAVVDYELDERDQIKMVDGIKEAARVFLRAGAKSVLTGHIRPTLIESIQNLKIVDNRGAGMGSLLVASAHPQGGNRMGENPANSVVNSFCQVHDVPNMFICDASVFPTSVGVNPQMTVMSIASMTADHINSTM
jgi:choline dehydrogenase-like flavoprotein